MLIFVDELSRFAAEVSDPRVTRIAEQVAAPLRVEVAGRVGVGRRTVARALDCAGFAVTPESAADVVCYVLAETVKPEDVAVVAALRRPLLVVLNKSDVPGGAVPAAVSARIGAPVAAMAALFAVSAADDRLDAGVRALLHRLSGVDTVAERLAGAGAAVRYRRALDAAARLEAVAVEGGPTARRIADFLSCDDTVLARMAAAADAVEAVGIRCGPAGGPADQLRRAVRWRRHRTAPLAAMHRACAGDIARGSLRLWSVALGAW